MSLVTEHLDADRPADVARAVALLRAGRLVAVPTETVYGLAADARNDAAVGRIFEAKGRPAAHPLIVHLAAPEQLGEWAAQVPRAAWRLAQAFWPGPLTMLLPRAESVSPRVTGGLPAVGLRVPAQPVLQAVLRDVDTGLAAPSANRYRRLSPTTAEHVLAGLAGRIDAVLDAGPCAVGLESTIVDLTGATPTLVRPGPVSRAQLEAVLGEPVPPAAPAVRAAGTERIHYRPSAPVCVVPAAQIAAETARYRAQGRTVALLLRGDGVEAPGDAPLVRLPTQREGYAQGLYGALHALDAAAPGVILVEAPPRSPDWLDVNDRLSRAAADWLTDTD